MLFVSVLGSPVLIVTVIDPPCTPSSIRRALPPLSAVHSLLHLPCTPPSICRVLPPQSAVHSPLQVLHGLCDQAVEEQDEEFWCRLYSLASLYFHLEKADATPLEST